jgi:hypothetical protein
MFLRRLGENSRQLCSAGLNCPQILEMVDGDFAAVGPDITAEAIKAMPPGPGIGPKEGAVRIPRAVMLAARAEIPAA